MEIKASEMIPIPINEFIMGAKVPVNLYIRLGEDKFILVAKVGSSTNKEQLKQFNSKEIQYLWVLKQEYGTVAQQSISLAGIIVNKREIDFRSKTAVMTNAARTVFTQFDHIGFSTESYGQAKTITDAVVGMCENHKELSEMFEGLKNCSDYLLAHSMAVSVLSVMIGQNMGFENRSTLEKLSLGGLLHDIGKKSLPPELLKKSLATMTPEETAYMETHCYRGMQMLHSLGIVPDDIVSIVFEHHENSLGQGYPQRIRDLKIHPLAKIVGLADQFVTLTIANPNCPNPKNIREALMYIEHTMGQPYSRDAFKALKKVIDRGAFTGAA